MNGRVKKLRDISLASRPSMEMMRPRTPTIE